MKRLFTSFVLVIFLLAPACAASGKQSAPAGAFQGAPSEYTRFSAAELERGFLALAFGSDLRIGARPRGSDTGLGQLRYVVVRHAEGICYFNLLAEGPDRDRRVEAMVTAARSLRTLSATEVATLRPYRLRIAPNSREPAAAVAARLPYGDLRLDRLLTLNGVDDVAAFARRGEIKTVER